MERGLQAMLGSPAEVPHLAASANDMSDLMPIQTGLHELQHIKDTACPWQDIGGPYLPVLDSRKTYRLRGMSLMNQNAFTL